MNEPPEDYRRLLAAYADGTPEAIADVVAPDVVYTIHGDADLSGTYHGPAGMVAWIGHAARLTDSTARFAPDVLLAGDSTVLAIGTATGTRAGVEHRTRHLYVLRWADGRLIEGHTVGADPAGFRSLWSADG